MQMWGPPAGLPSQKREGGSGACVSPTAPGDADALPPGTAAVQKGHHMWVLRGHPAPPTPGLWVLEPWVLNEAAENAISRCHLPAAPVARSEVGGRRWGHGTRFLSLTRPDLGLVRGLLHPSFLCPGSLACAGQAPPLSQAAAFRGAHDWDNHTRPVPQPTELRLQLQRHVPGSGKYLAGPAGFWKILSVPEVVCQNPSG